MKKGKTDFELGYHDALDNVVTWLRANYQNYYCGSDKDSLELYGLISEMEESVNNKLLDRIKKNKIIMARKIVKEISGMSQLELALLEKEDNANSCQAKHHDPWKPCYIVIENAHGCYPEMGHGTYDSFEEAEKALDLMCKKYGGRIESTTWGEITNCIL